MRAPNHGPTDIHDILTLTSTGPISVPPTAGAAGPAGRCEDTAGSAAA